MDDEHLDLTLAKIGRITNIEEFLQRKIGTEDVFNSYSEDDSLYQRVYSKAGSMHIALCEDGRFHQDGYYGQARMVQKAIEETNPQQVLELCSGRGFNLIYLAKQNPHVQFHGVDLVPGNIHASNKRSKLLSNLRCQVGNIEELEYPSEAFDIAFIVESLFHVADLPKALSEAYRVLKPGGRMIIFDYYRKSDLEALEPGQRNAILVEENAFTILSPMSTNGFVEAAQTAGFRVLKAEEISRHARPGVMRLYRLVDLVFKVPLAAGMIARALSSNVIDIIVGWELMPSLFEANLVGYFQMEFERL